MAKTELMPTPRVVLYVQYPSDLYGAGRCLLRLIERLDSNRYRPIVLLTHEGAILGKLEALGVKVILHKQLSLIERRTLRSWRFFLLFPMFVYSVLKIRSIIKEEKVDIVHTNTGIILSSALAAKMARVPHVWHIRDWFGEFAVLWKPFSQYILWGSDKILCVSSPVARQFPVDEKVVVVNDGFSLEEFMIDKEKVSSEFRRAYGLESSFVIGTVGRIKFLRKGQEFLVQAAHILRLRGYDFHYIIVGSVFPGNEEHLVNLQKLILSLGLERNVHLVGELEDAKPTYAAMDVFVLPSAQPEPFGGVVMEAMAMGLPVIGTNIGGTVEQVLDGETGYLINPQDPQALAEKIEFLYQNQELRLRLGKAGIERIRTTFSLERMVKMIETSYHDTLMSKEIESVRP